MMFLVGLGWSTMTKLVTVNLGSNADAENNVSRELG